MPTETERSPAPDLINGMGRSSSTASSSTSKPQQQLLGGNGGGGQQSGAKNGCSGSVRIPLMGGQAGVKVKLTQGVGGGCGGGGSRNTVKIQNPSSQLLEQKVASLEKRLSMVERFIGKKFCGESFMDFASASLNNQSDDGDRNESGSNPSQKKRKTQESNSNDDESIDTINGGSTSTSTNSSSTTSFPSTSTSSSATGAPCTVVSTFSLAAPSTSIFTSITTSSTHTTDTTPSSSRWQDSSADASNFTCTNDQDEEMDIGNVILHKLDSGDNYLIGDDDNDNEHVNIDDIKNFGNGSVPTLTDQPSIILNTGSGTISCFGDNDRDDGVTYTTTGTTVTTASTSGSIGVGPPPLVMVPTDNHSDDGESHQNFIEDEESFGMDMELEESLNAHQNGNNDNDENTGSQSCNRDVPMSSSIPISTSQTQSGSNGAAMPTEEYLKRIGYNHRLHICPYCKSPCKINNRFRHLRKSCQVTPEQLRFEEGNKGSVEHWPKATLADYENFYKDDISILRLCHVTTATAEIKKRKGSALKLNQGRGQGSVKTSNEKNTVGELTAAVGVPVPRGRGRPKGTFKMFRCSKCNKKMHRIALEEHKKKCRGKQESDTTDDDTDNSDDDYDHTLFSKVVNRVPKERKSAPAAVDSMNKNSTTIKKIADGQTLTMRGRGRPTGTFKIYTCNKCGKKMLRKSFKDHQKKCANKLSNTEDHHDDGDGGVGYGMRKMKATLTSVATPSAGVRNSIDKIGNCTVCGKSMLSRSIPRHLREACPGGRYQ